MLDFYTIWTCVALCLLSWLYARLLQRIRVYYESRLTWLMTALGIAMVEAVIAIRLLVLPIPDYAGRELLGWSLWQWWWHLVAAGLPIAIWRILDDRAALVAALNAALERKSPKS